MLLEPNIYGFKQVPDQIKMPLKYTKYFAIDAQLMKEFNFADGYFS